MYNQYDPSGVLCTSITFSVSLMIFFFQSAYAAFSAKRLADKIPDDYDLLKAKNKEIMADLFSSQSDLEKSQKQITKLEAELRNALNLNNSLNDLFVNSKFSLEK